MKILSVMMILTSIIFTQNSFAQDDHNEKIQAPTPSSSNSSPGSNGPDDYSSVSSDSAKSATHK